ncbi:hypothetical protein ACHQM5_029886 [Ranunculus cassubicifolius]
MDSKYTTEMYKHLEKQSEVLMEAYRSMSHELHRLQIEEEMLMRKFYEVMKVEGLAEKRNSEYFLALAGVSLAMNSGVKSSMTGVSKPRLSTITLR